MEFDEEKRKIMAKREDQIFLCDVSNGGDRNGIV
jgi:hypothetical protein